MDLPDRKRAFAAGVLVVIGLVGTAWFFGRTQTVAWQWRHHESQVREALAAGDGRDVTAAIVFFENATGVTSQAGTDEAGTRTVVPAVEQELRAWDTWFAAHRACLEWDILEQRLELLKGCED